MNSQNTNFDRIEAYLFGQMSAEENAGFEREIAENADLAAEVEHQRLEHRAMELLLREELRANLNTWKAEKEALAAPAAGTGAKVVSMGSNRRLLYRIAAAASVLLIIGFFSRQFFAGANHEQLALQYFAGSETGYRGDGPANPLDPVYDAMNRQDWRAALGALDRVSTADYRMTALQLRGECQFRLKEYTASVTTFETLLAANPAAEIREQAEWDLLMAYLAEGKHKAEQERLLMQLVEDAGHPYQEKAVELKGKM